MHPTTARLMWQFEPEEGDEDGPLTGLEDHFREIAHAIADGNRLEGPDVTVALRKLLESRDACRRAARASYGDLKDHPLDL